MTRSQTLRYIEIVHKSGVRDNFISSDLKLVADDIDETSPDIFVGLFIRSPNGLKGSLVQAQNNLCEFTGSVGR